MAFAYRGRKIGSIPFVAGQKMSLDVPRDGVVTAFYFRLRFTGTTDAANAAVGPLFNTLARPLRNIDFQIGGKDTVFSMSGEMAAARALFDQGTPAYGMTDTAVLTAGTATAYDVVVPIHRILPRGRRPDDCGDDLRFVTQAVLSVTWGTANGSDLFTTPDADYTITAVTLDVFADYLMVPKDDKAVFLTRDFRQITAQPTASNTSLKQIIDGRSGYYVNSILLATLDDKVASNGVLNNIQELTGSWTWRDMNATMIRGWNKGRYGLETAPTGLYMLDSTLMGELTQAINTDPQKTVADLELMQDVTYVATVTDLIYNVESVRPAAYL